MFGLDRFPSSKSGRKFGLKEKMVVAGGGERRKREIGEDRGLHGFSGFDGFEEDRGSEQFGNLGGEGGDEKGREMGVEIEEKGVCKAESKEKKSEDLKMAILEGRKERIEISSETQERLQKGSNFA